MREMGHRLTPNSSSNSRSSRWRNLWGKGKTPRKSWHTWRDCQMNWNDEGAKSLANYVTFERSNYRKFLPVHGSSHRACRQFLPCLARLFGRDMMSWKMRLRISPGIHT